MNNPEDENSQWSPIHQAIYGHQIKDAIMQIILTQMYYEPFDCSGIERSI